MEQVDVLIIGAGPAGVGGEIPDVTLVLAATTKSSWKNKQPNTLAPAAKLRLQPEFFF